MDDFEFIIGILVFLVLGVYQAVSESRSKKRREEQERAATPKTVASIPSMPNSTGSWQSEILSAVERAAATPRQPDARPLPEEGARVTADTPPMEAVADDDEGPVPPEVEELRRGIIMAEILTPKFMD